MEVAGDPMQAGRYLRLVGLRILIWSDLSHSVAYLDRELLARERKFGALHDTVDGVFQGHETQRCDVAPKDARGAGDEHVAGHDPLIPEPAGAFYLPESFIVTTGSVHHVVLRFSLGSVRSGGQSRSRNAQLGGAHGHDG